MQVSSLLIAPDLELMCIGRMYSSLALKYSDMDYEQYETGIVSLTAHKTTRADILLQ
jgi:hypothetical protein